eukprot:TRINITY_DN674_c0_g1_i1.p1 TRINITY_DN674_c0_g1~~TRINITY_DN674_c0_g1_i1.p1  ORF type:complete len:1788 (+),score=332.31 TRINITY_DN674_c0_g1_i1:113-5476(+)
MDNFLPVIPQTQQHATAYRTPRKPTYDKDAVRLPLLTERNSPDEDDQALEIRLASLDERIARKAKEAEFQHQRRKEEQSRREREQADKVQREREQRATETEEARIRREYNNRKREREMHRQFLENQRKQIAQETGTDADIAALEAHVSSLMSPRPPTYSPGTRASRPRMGTASSPGKEDENEVAFAWLVDGVFLTPSDTPAADLGIAAVPRRSAVSSQVVDEAASEQFVPVCHPKSDEESETLTQTLKHHYLFTQLDSEDLKIVVDAMVPQKFPKNEVIIRAGEEGHNFFVISTGTVQVLRDGDIVATLRVGQCFGELELMYNTRCVATVYAAADTECWVLDRLTYRHVVMQVSIQKRQLFEQLLSNVKFLRGMSHYDMLTLADALQPVQFAPGDYLVRYGEDGNLMYIILEGTAEVLGRDSDGDPVFVCEFSYGDPVGELEFINNHPCVADVIAKTYVGAVFLHREHFELCMGPVKDYLQDTAMHDVKYTYYQERINEPAFDWDKSADFASQLASPSIRGTQKRKDTSGVRRAGVSAAAVEKDFVPPPAIPKSPQQLQQLRSVLSRNPLFSQLERSELETVMAIMQPATFDACVYILRQGEENDKFYVVSTGTCTCIKNGKEVKVFVPGEAFGELELMYSSLCAASIRADTDNTELWVLDRASYQHLVMKVSMQKRALYCDLLSKIEWLSSMSQYDLLTLADALQPASFEPGDIIIAFGSDGQWMHIILEGAVEVEGRDDSGKVIDVCELGVGDPIGELEFIHGHKCVADVVAKTAVRTAKIKRDHFEMCMGPIVDVLKDREKREDYTYYSTFDWNRTGTEWLKFNEVVRSPTPPNGDRRQSGAHRRVAVASKPVDANTQWRSISKSPTTQKSLESILRANALFSQVEEEHLVMVAEAMDEQEFKAGDYVCKQDEESDAFYIISAGQAEVIKNGERIAVLDAGAAIGDTELMYTSPASASVRARTDLHTWILDGDTYRTIAVKTHFEKRKLYEELLSGVDFLRGMTHEELLTLADALQPMYFKKGEKIIRYGEEGEWMYIVLDGTVEVWGRDASGEILNVCEFGYGDPIGELEFINNHPCVADVVAKTNVKTVRLNRRHFELCMGPVVDVLKRHAQSETYSYYSGATAGFNFNSTAMQSFVQRVTSADASPGRSVLEELPVVESSNNLGIPTTQLAQRRSTDIRRVAVSAALMSGELEDTAKLEKFEKPAEVRKLLVASLTPKTLFSHLEPKNIEGLVDIMQPLRLNSNETIPRGEDDDTAEGLFVVVEGLAIEQPDRRLAKGDSFGDEALMHSVSQRKVVKAVSPLTLYLLPRDHYQHVVAQVSKQRRTLYQELLSNVPFLQSMSNGELLQLADALQPAHYQPGDYLIRFGEEGEWMHIIVEGAVEVWGRAQDGHMIDVCEFGSGDPIGELEFLNKHKCVADVVAKTETHTVRLNRNHFELCMGPVADILRRRVQTETYSYYSAFDWTSEQFSLNTPERHASFKRRSGVAASHNRHSEIEAAETDAAGNVPVVYPKSPSVQQFLATVLADRPLLADLEPEVIQALVGAMTDFTGTKDGEQLISEGSQLDALWVVFNGEAESKEQHAGSVILRRGDVFGDAALLYPISSSSSIIVTDTPCQLYRLDRNVYRQIVTTRSQQKRKLYEDLLGRIPFLRTMNREELLSVAEALHSTVYHKGDQLITYGSEGQWMHIILEGEVLVVGRDGFNKPLPVCTFGPGQPVGELEFINNHTCMADVIAQSEVVRTAKLNRRHFELVLGPVIDVLKQNAQSDVYSYYTARLKALKK